jgi:hypothetical protein
MEKPRAQGFLQLVIVDYVGKIFIRFEHLEIIVFSFWSRMQQFTQPQLGVGIDLYHFPHCVQCRIAHFFKFAIFRALAFKITVLLTLGTGEIYVNRRSCRLVLAKELIGVLDSFLKSCRWGKIQ